jgi:hypothetical protein
MGANVPCKGIKKAALQSLPTVSWPARPRREEECAICLAEFASGDVVRVLPPCGHGFHAACVDVWLLSSSTCPSCRRALVVGTAADRASSHVFMLCRRRCRGGGLVNRPLPSVGAVVHETDRPVRVRARAALDFLSQLVLS